MPKGEEDREETKAVQASRTRMIGGGIKSNGGGWRRGFGGGGMR